MVSVILPTYNEAENIIGLIEALLHNIQPPLEIIVVDDNSSDCTWRLVEELRKPDIKVVRRIDQRGLATAIERGIQESKGDIVCWMDADMCMPPAVLAEMIQRVKRYDVAIGSRYVNGGRDARGFFRVFTSRLINWFAGFVLGFDIKDYDSGFIALKKYVFDRVSLPAKGYGDYFIEFIYRCKRAGFSLTEVPYVFNDRTKGTSKTASGIISFCKLGFGYFLRIIHLRFSK